MFDGEILRKKFPFKNILDLEDKVQDKVQDRVQDKVQDSPRQGQGESWT